MSAQLPLPDALRAYRAALGLTQAQLAARWGVPTNTIARWEQDARAPRVAGLIRRLIEIDRAAP